MSDTVRRLLETISRLQASLQAQADRLPAEAAATREKRRRLAAADKGARTRAAAALRVRVLRLRANWTSLSARGNDDDTDD
jgi:hypothetical protein